MTGWEKVVAATLLAVIGLAGLNLAIWRRMRAAVRACPAELDDIHAARVYPERRDAGSEVGEQLGGPHPG